jgi:lipopolysaccharide exporter
MAPPLGDIAARGVAWMAIQSLASKVAATLGQVVLAWLVLPEEWGLVGLAYTVFSIASLVQTAGVREVLIYRQSRLDRWANPAFWLGMCVSSAAGLLSILGAPIAARIYDQPEVIGLIVVLALSAPLGALSWVPQAKLQAQMRLRAVAVVQFAASVATVALSILMAAMDFGAYSFVWPRLIVAVGQAAVLWWCSRPDIRWNPQIRRWRFLVSSTGWLLGVSVGIAIMSQAPSAVLGALFDEHTVGIFYFAFNLSTQTMQLVGISLASALLPALSKLQDEPLRMRDASLRTLGVISVISMPLSLLQVAQAGPAIRLIFPAEWEPSIPVLAVLSFGMAILCPTISAQSIFQAQGRFRSLFVAMLVTTLTYVLAIVAAIYIRRDSDPSLAVAWAVTIHTTVVWPINLYVAIRPIGGTWRDVGGILLKPLLVSSLAVGVPHAVRGLVPAVRDSDLLYLITGSLLTVAIYIRLITWLAPKESREIITRLRSYSRKQKTAITMEATTTAASVDSR